MAYGDTDAAVARAIKERGYEFPVIFDIGGSNGSWVNITSKVFNTSRFELFEPLAEIHPKYIEILKYLKHVYQESYMHPVAIGEKDGSIEISVFEDPSGSTTLPIGFSEGASAQVVPLRSVDSIVQSGMCRQPDLIKIDIQGGELAALKGAEKTLKDVKFLMLETWLQRGYGKSTPLLSDLIQYLAPRGFFPYEFADVYRGHHGETMSIDVWFINRAFAKNQHAF